MIEYYVPPNPQAAIPTPQVMLLGCGVFVRRLGHEGGASVKGITDALSPVPEFPPCSYDVRTHGGKDR